MLGWSPGDPWQPRCFAPFGAFRGVGESFWKVDVSLAGSRNLENGLRMLLDPAIWSGHEAPKLDRQAPSRDAPPRDPPLADLLAGEGRHAPAGARVANNPLFLRDLTPWPANMSWALLADRSSCFAGRELAIPFAALSPERRAAINDQFIRVFAGQAMPADVGEFATKYGCDIVVVVPQDGAWADDPFAASTDYRLVESRDDRWRIYVRAGDRAH